MAVASLLRAHGLRFAAGLCSKLSAPLAGCKTLASSYFASQPIRSSHMARSPPPAPWRVRAGRPNVDFSRRHLDSSTPLLSPSRCIIAALHAIAT